MDLHAVSMQEKLIGASSLLILIMRRALVLTFIVLASIASVFSLVYRIPVHVQSTYLSTSVRTAINPEVLVDYSTATVTCTGSLSICYQHIVPYTHTETWSARTTEAGTILSTSMRYVPIATSGVAGNMALLVSLIVLSVALAMFAKDGFAGRKS